jgi:hypothetical protein
LSRFFADGGDRLKRKGLGRAASFQLKIAQIIVLVVKRIAVFGLFVVCGSGLALLLLLVLIFTIRF